MEKELLQENLKSMYNQVADMDNMVILMSALLFVYVMFLLLVRKQKNKEEK